MNTANKPGKRISPNNLRNQIQIKTNLNTLIKNKIVFIPQTRIETETMMKKYAIKETKESINYGYSNEINLDL